MCPLAILYLTVILVWSFCWFFFTKHLQKKLGELWFFLTAVFRFGFSNTGSDPSVSEHMKWTQEMLLPLTDPSDRPQATIRLRGLHCLKGLHHLTFFPDQRCLVTFIRDPKGKKKTPQPKMKKGKTFVTEWRINSQCFWLPTVGNNWGHRRITGVVWEDRGAVA